MLGGSLAGIHSTVVAMEGDVIRPYVNATYSYDDNLRRFNNTQQALATTGSSKTSDTMLMTGVGIILDKQISQQNLYFDINVNRSKFDRYSELDNDGKELTGRWDWKVGKRLDGKIELHHKEALVPFSDFQGLALNQRKQDRRLVEGRWWLHPRWRIRGALVNAETRYSSVSQQLADLDETSQELAFDYLSPSKSVVGVMYRHARGDKPQQMFFGVPISNDYDQNELKLNVDWTVTGKTKLQFLGGLVERKHDDLPQRDFRGFNARGNIAWQATGKSDLRLSVWRENNAQSFVTTSYTLNRGTSLTASYVATGKIVLQGSARYEKRDFEGDSALGLFRTDTDKNFTMTVIYQALNDLKITASLTRSDRDSSVQQAGFKSNGISLTGMYEF